MSQTPSSDTFAASVRTHLASVERRDWELWVLALSSIGVMTAGVVLLLVPGFMAEDRVIRLSATVTPAMLLAFVFFVGVLLIYLVTKQVQLRAARLASINESWNYEVSRLQLLLDPLTRVYNRATLHDILAKELSRAKRHRSPITLLYVDVDDFKGANTGHGHLFGDLVLAEVGGILKGSTRGSDFVFRIGGDEFLVALIDTGHVGGEIVTRRIHHRVEEWNKISPAADYRLSLSCGIQEVDPDGTLDEALAKSDAKMYAEKQRPGGQ